MTEGDGWLQFSPVDVNAVAAFVDEEMGLTEESSKRYCREKEEVRALAERLILEFERERLLHAGHMVEHLGQTC